MLKKVLLNFIVKLYNGCALAYHMLWQYEESLNYCKKLLDYPSYEFEDLILQGECLEYISRRIEAIESFEKTVESII